MYTAKNIIAPIQINKKLNSNLTGQERYNFNSNFLLENFQSSIGTNPLETKITYNNYDAKGNAVELQKNNDIKYSYLWGYNFQYPIAEIENAGYSEIVAVLSQAVLDGFNTNPGTDDQLRQALNVLRQSPALQKARITTYTYNPLVGMTSKTDVNNQITYFEYDQLNRVKLIKDYQGNILKRYEYNYQIR